MKEIIHTLGLGSLVDKVDDALKYLWAINLNATCFNGREEDLVSILGHL